MEDRYLYKAKTTPKEKGEFNNVWVTGNLIVSNGKYYIHPVGNVVNVKNETGRIIVMHEVIPDTICQCTGLKDKNGKLIWENDIIKTFDAGEECCLSKIIFADTSLGYGWKTTDIKSLSKYNNNLFKEVSFGSFDSKSAEIVGNIFDNAELLESEG